MKKTLALVLALLLLTACLAGCAKPDAPAPSAAPTPTEAPTPSAPSAPPAESDGERTFTVGFDAEFPPFGFIAEDGSYDGFDLAVAAEVCERLGWTFAAQPINWDFKDAELASGTIDCIWNGFTIEGREDAYTWSPAYYDSSVVVVVRADSGIASLADLAGKSVITQAASSGLAALEGNPELTNTFGELLESADYNNAFMELGMGTVDAVVADVGVANYNMQGKSGSYVVLEEAVSVETYGIGFLKGSDELMQQVWDTVISIAADGTMAELADKYVPYGLVKENVTLISAAQAAQPAVPEGRTFTVGFDAEFPPFGFIAEDGSYDGFDLAVAAEVCERLGWTFAAQPINWDFKDAELASGTIDCIWNGFTIEGREDAYTWSPAYYDSSVVVVVRADSGIASLADLAGKSVITQAASSGLAALEGNPELTNTFGELLESADYNNAFMELGMGTVDAVVADVGVANYNMQGKSGSYVVLEEAVSVETYGIGFLKGSDELMQQVWDTVISIAADGTMAELADKYVPYGLVKENVTLIG